MSVVHSRTKAFVEFNGSICSIKNTKFVGKVPVHEEILAEEDNFGFLFFDPKKGTGKSAFEVEFDIAGEDG